MSVGDTAPQFLADEDFNYDIVAGLRWILPGIDILTAAEAKTLGMPDPALLEWARAHDRILLTHDSNTMPHHFYSFLAALTPDAHSPGVMLIEQNLAIGLAIMAVQDIWELSSHAEWQNQFIYLPLRH